MKISIEIGNGTPAELKIKEAAIKLLAQQEVKILERLMTLAKSTKAIDFIKNNWLTLKILLGL